MLVGKLYNLFIEIVFSFEKDRGDRAIISLLLLIERIRDLSEIRVIIILLKKKIREIKHKFNEKVNISLEAKEVT